MTTAPRERAAPRPGPGRLLGCWHAAGLLFWRVIFTRLNRIDARGLEHLPAKDQGDVFILANHVSAIDPFLIGVTAMPLFSPVWWRALAKSELFARPLIGALLRSWGALPVERGRRDLAAITALARGVQGSVLVAFPEGTRATGGRLLPGRPGLGQLIYEARPRAIIPAAIEGTDGILPKGRILPRLGRTARIVYGRPVDVSRFYALPASAETSQLIIDEVMRAIAALQTTEHP
ncbi:MAG: lysophospholipid acyltransferase family protein [Nitrospirota bacterium]